MHTPPTWIDKVMSTIDAAMLAQPLLTSGLVFGGLVVTLMLLSTLAKDLW